MAALNTAAGVTSTTVEVEVAVMAMATAATLRETIALILLLLTFSQASLLQLLLTAGHNMVTGASRKETATVTGREVATMATTIGDHRAEPMAGQAVGTMARTITAATRTEATTVVVTATVHTIVADRTTIIRVMADPATATTVATTMLTTEATITGGVVAVRDTALHNLERRPLTRRGRISIRTSLLLTTTSRGIPTTIRDIDARDCFEQASVLEIHDDVQAKILQGYSVPMYGV